MTNCEKCIFCDKCSCDDGICDDYSPACADAIEDEVYYKADVRGRYWLYQAQVEEQDT